MPQHDVFPIKVVPFPDVPSLERALRALEREGLLITDLSLKEDQNNPARKIEGYFFDLPPDIPPPELVVEGVPEAARNDKDAFESSSRHS